MTTVTVSDDQGQLTVTVDGQEPQPISDIEQACQAVEMAFGMADETEEQAMASAQKGYGPKNARPTPKQVFGEGM